MPLNTDIPLSIPPFQMVSPLEQATKALTLSGLIDQQRQRQMAMEEAQRKAALEQKFRAGLRPDMTPEQRAAHAAQYAGPEALLTDAQRRTTAENNRQMALSRLQQVASQAQMAHEDRMSKLDREDLRIAETQRYNRFMEGMQTHAQSVAGERLFYDTGQRVAMPPQAATMGQSPSGPPANLVANAPTEEAAALMATQFANRNPQGNVRVGVGFMPPEIGAQQGSAPAPIAPPAFAPPALTSAPPNNFDSRDLRFPAIGPQPAAPAVAPAAKSAIPPMPPEIAAAPPRIQNQWRLQQTRISIAGGGTLNPETLQFVAKQYLAGDRQAVQGFARNATARIALQNAIVDEARSRGMTPEQTAAQIADFAGTMAGSRTVGQRAANISLAATEAEEMLGIVKETSDKFGRTNFVPWNMALRAYASGTGSPEIAEFGAAVNALVNVYARAINPTGVPTVSDKEHARAVLNTVQSPAQVDAVLGIIKRELAIAKKAPAAVQAATRARVSGQGAETFSDPEKERRYQEWKRSQGQ